jgi:hypothetical protein
MERDDLLLKENEPQPMLRWFQLGSLIERVRTGSALAPILVLTLISAAAAFSTTVSHSLHGSDGLMWCLWGLFALCVVTALVVYCGFAINDPERLQTEDYRLARHRLDLIGDERDPNSDKLIEAPPTANTYLGVTR